MLTPTIGQPLPRAAEAYAAPEKWEDWILADRGHGPEWARVFRIGLDDAGRLWRAIADGILLAPVFATRDVSPYGFSCQVGLVLTLNDRAARALTIWHYESASHPPRLVTAYPTP
jgi:hypothetical protein